jgi:transposase
MGKQRQAYSPELKNEAVKMVVSNGRTTAAVAKELSVVEPTLGKWVKTDRD